MLRTWLLAGGLLSAPAFAKGLNEIKAQADTEPAKPADSTPEAAPAEGAAKPPEGETKPPEGETKPPEGEPVSSERSALSLKLEDRLFLATSMNYATVSGGTGAWSSFGNGDLTAGWRVKDGLPRNGRLFATARFAPFDVVVAADQHSYRGVVEGWYFGALGLFAMSDKMSVSGGGELGYMVVHMDSADHLPIDNSIEKAGVSINLSGGVDWKMMDKFLIGPKLGLGFGAFKTLQVGAKATFFF